MTAFLPKIRDDLRFRQIFRLYPDYRTFHVQKETVDPILPALKRLRRDLGCHNILYHCLMTDRRSTHPSRYFTTSEHAFGALYVATHSIHWGLQYLFHDYNRIDPLINSAITSHNPVDWQTLKHATDDAKTFWQQMEQYGVGTFGLSIPLHDFLNRPALCSFSFKTNHKSWPGLKRTIETKALFAAINLHETILEASGAFPRERDLSITPDEHTFLSLIAHGWDTSQISGTLDLSPLATRDRLQRLMGKLQAKNTAHLVAKAAAAGLITVD